jgi:hypothetical protein
LLCHRLQGIRQVYAFVHRCPFAFVRRIKPIVVATVVLALPRSIREYCSDSTDTERPIAYAIDLSLHSDEIDCPTRTSRRIQSMVNILLANSYMWHYTRHMRVRWLEATSSSKTDVASHRLVRRCCLEENIHVRLIAREMNNDTWHVHSIEHVPSCTVY